MQVIGKHINRAELRIQKCTLYKESDKGHTSNTRQKDRLLNENLWGAVQWRKDSLFNK